MGKGQVSIEYLLVVGFTFLLLVPLLVLFSYTQRDTTSSLIESNAQNAGTAIRDAAERVYFAGEPSQETVQVTFPDEIKSIEGTNDSLLFTIYGPNGEYELPIYSVAPIQGNISPGKGPRSVTVIAQGGVVHISG